MPQAHPEGFEIIGEANGRRFIDDGYSGSKRNRGPGLERAIDAADEHGEAELWANTSARFGRGTGRRDEARAIGELFYELRRKGVRLHAVQDDELVANEMLVGIGSTIAAKLCASRTSATTPPQSRSTSSSPTGSAVLQPGNPVLTRTRFLFGS